MESECLIIAHRNASINNKMVLFLDFHSSVLTPLLVMMMVFLSVLSFVVSLLLMDIFGFWFWLSYNNEAIIFKIFDLLSSELTSFFFRIRASTLLLSLLTFFLFIFRSILTFFSFSTLSSVVVASIGTFSSIRSISVFSVSVISSFTLLSFASNWFLWLLYSRLSNSLLLNNRCRFLLDSNFGDFRNSLNNWFWFCLSYRNLRLRRNNCFNFSDRFFSLNFLFLRLLF